MAKINTNIGSAFLNFTFSDEDGEVISSFKMNPADVKVAVRSKEVSEYLSNKKNTLDGDMTPKEMAEFNDELEEKICYVLGYDARNDLFKPPMTATTILPSGDLFAAVVLEKIAEAVKPELEKRHANMERAAAKYTSRYDVV